MPPRPTTPGNRKAHAIGEELRPGRLTGEIDVVEAALVRIAIVELTPASWPGRISTFSGVKVHEASSGSPEHDSTTKAGPPPNDATNSSDGTTVTCAVPVCPGVSVFAGVVAGVRFDTVTAYAESHCELIVTEAGEDVEPAKVAFALYTALSECGPSGR
jgi:hypothetical protein